MEHIVIRTCIGCGAKKEKKEFVRIVKNKENEINIDKTGKNVGRGAYICESIDCLTKLKKSKKNLEKSFKMRIDNDNFERLMGKFIDRK